tara:strand:+ start:409 stop:1113 length:705 start_codon:yes stop_codon:yes gene_type:complete
MDILIELIVIIVGGSICGAGGYGMAWLCLEITKKVKLWYKNYKDKRKGTDGVEIDEPRYRSIPRYIPTAESSFNNSSTILPDGDNFATGDLPNHIHIQTTHVDHSTILPDGDLPNNNNDQQLRQEMLRAQRDLDRDLDRRRYEVMQDTINRWTQTVSGFNFILGNPTTTSSTPPIGSVYKYEGDICVYDVVGTFLYGLIRVSDGEVVLTTMFPNEKYRLPLEPTRNIKKFSLWD